MDIYQQNSIYNYKMKRVSNQLRSLDSFGEAPKLLYKGEDTYKTKLGGFISLLIKIFLLVYLAIKVKSLVLREAPTINTTDKFVDTRNDETRYDIKNYDFSLVALVFPKGF